MRATFRSPGRAALSCTIDPHSRRDGILNSKRRAAGAPGAGGTMRHERYVAISDQRRGLQANGIGPACDIAANTCSGCLAPSPTIANGNYHATLIVSNVCIGPAGSDSDGDGVCNVNEPAGCINNTDCDGDLVSDRFDNCIGGSNPKPPNFAQSQRDLTADGFSDITDISLLTNVFGSGGFSGVATTNPNGYEGRFDLQYDGFIDISDISLLTGIFGAAC